MGQRIFLVALVLLSSCASVTKPKHEISFQSGYAPVNGIQMYFEVHGPSVGVPLVLLNGGGSTIDVSYGRILPFLSQHRQVISLEEQGHGRTSDRDQPFSPGTSAKDVVALLDHLHIKQADVMGFSNGAGVAMEVAIRYPDRVRKLVFISYFTKRKGAQPRFWGFMKNANFANMPQPLKDAFLKVNPDPKKLENMCAKDIARMRNFQDVPDREVKGIRAPTLLISGDRDVSTPEHAVELSHLISGSRLMILPGGHGEVLGELLTGKPGSRVPEFTAGFINEFLAQ